MSWAIVCKVFQRRSIDLLSHKNGIFFVLILLTLLVLSVFHFGEVIVLWTSDKYTCVFDSYRDNIAGRSYQKQICSKLPIDVVYTWVNGSDPTLIEQLKVLKERLTESSNKSQDRSRCRLANCIPANGIVVIPSILLSEQSVHLKSMFPFAKKTPKIFQISDGSTIDNIATCILFETREEVELALMSNQTSIDPKMFSVKRLYYTSDGTHKGVYKENGFVLSLGFPEKFDDENSMKMLEKYGGNFFTNLLIDTNTGIASFVVSNNTIKNKIIADKNFTVSGKIVTFLESFIFWEIDHSSDGRDEISANRFRDSDELKFSLRSLEKFAPWVRKVFIVTNGQIPSWLNLDNPRIKMITHNDIFSDLSHLPTFSSPAIESHLHEIPGLSNQFIYLNDDVFFGQPVWPEDFVSAGGVHKVYLTYPVPDCRSGCPGSWIRDGYCDRACNCSECDWDGGDCFPNSTSSRRNNRFPGINANQPGNFPWLNSLQSQYCNPGCADNWIADRYCDTSCNVYKCGYDAGDCGDDSFENIQKVHLVLDQKEYYYLGYTVLHFDFSGLIGADSFIAGGEFSDDPIVRSFSFMNSSKLLVLILKSNHSRTSVPITLTVAANNLSSLNFNFTIILDTTLEESPVSKPINSGFSTSPLPRIDSELDKNIQVVLDPLPKPKLVHFRPLNLSLQLLDRDLPDEIMNDLQSALLKLNSNHLTEKGFAKEQERILKEYLEKNNKEWTSLEVENFLLDHPIKSPANNFKKIKNMSNPSQVRPLKKEVLKKMEKEKSLDIAQIFRRGLKNHKLTNVSETDYFKQFNYGFFPWEKKKIFKGYTEKLEEKDDDHHHQVENRFGRRLMDAFAESIKHVNRLYNNAYGYFARKVPAHTAHYFDKQILTELQQKFSYEWEQTSSHKVRSDQDMQLAFSYYYYLISEQVNVSIEHIFNEFDLDKSGVWSDRELRIFATKVFDLPLLIKDLMDLESNLVNCSFVYQPKNESIYKLEKYYDQRLPQITLDYVANCQTISDILLNKFSRRKKFETKTILNTDELVTFKMITNNATIIVRQLDDVRKNPKKFICLNDDLDDEKDPVGASNARALIRDFYVTFFPEQSQFERKSGFRNRYFTVEEHEKHVQNGNTLNLILIALILLCIYFLWRELCKGKLKHLFRRRRKH